MVGFPTPHDGAAGMKEKVACDDKNATLIRIDSCPLCAPPLSAPLCGRGREARAAGLHELDADPVLASLEEVRVADLQDVGARLGERERLGAFPHPADPRP